MRQSHCGSVCKGAFEKEKEFYYRKRGANIEIRCDWKHIWKGRCSPLHILLAYSPQSLIFFPPFYDHHPVFGQKTRIICLFTEFGPFSRLLFPDCCSTSFEILLQSRNSSYRSLKWPLLRLFPTFFLFPPSFKNTSSREFKTRARKKASADCWNSNSGAKVHNVGEVGVMAQFQSSKAIISGLYK